MGMTRPGGGHKSEAGRKEKAEVGILGQASGLGWKKRKGSA